MLLAYAYTAGTSNSSLPLDFSFEPQLTSITACYSPADFPVHKSETGRIWFLTPPDFHLLGSRWLFAGTVAPGSFSSLAAQVRYGRRPPRLFHRVASYVRSLSGCQRVSETWLDGTFLGHGADRPRIGQRCGYGLQ